MAPHFRSAQRGILLAALCMLLFSMLFLYRGPVAFLVWESTHSPILATLFSPNDEKLLFEIGNYYFNHGSYDLEKSRLYFEKSLSLKPDYLEPKYQIARIDFLESRFLESLDGIEAVLEIDPEFTKGYYMLGLVNGYIHNFDQAEYGFQEFIKRDTTHNWAGHNDLAWIYFRQGKYEQARVAADEGLRYSPGNPWLNNIYGITLLNLDDPEGARAALVQAQAAMDQITPEIWGRSYPGNNPVIYAEGLKEMRETIQHNIDLIDKKD